MLLFVLLFVATLTAIPILTALELNRIDTEEANNSWIQLTFALDMLTVVLLTYAAPSLYSVLSVSEYNRNNNRWVLSSAIFSVTCCMLQLWICKTIVNAPMIVSLASSLITEKESVTIQLA